jgi:hypothetical protein
MSPDGVVADDILGRFFWVLQRDAACKRRVGSGSIRLTDTCATRPISRVCVRVVWRGRGLVERPTKKGVP